MNSDDYDLNHLYNNQNLDDTAANYIEPVDIDPNLRPRYDEGDFP
jgi:hypothetical protein